MGQNVFWNRIQLLKKFFHQLPEVGAVNEGAFEQGSREGQGKGKMNTVRKGGSKDPARGKLTLQPPSSVGADVRTRREGEDKGQQEDIVTGSLERVSYNEGGLGRKIKKI